MAYTGHQPYCASLRLLSLFAERYRSFFCNCLELVFHFCFSNCTIKCNFILVITCGKSNHTFIIFYSKTNGDNTSSPFVVCFSNSLRSVRTINHLPRVRTRDYICSRLFLIFFVLKCFVMDVFEHFKSSRLARSIGITVSEQAFTISSV